MASDMTPLVIYLVCVVALVCCVAAVVIISSHWDRVVVSFLRRSGVYHLILWQSILPLQLPIIPNNGRQLNIG